MWQIAVSIHIVDESSLIKVKAGQMANAESFSQFVDNKNIRARFTHRLDQFWPQHHVLLSTAAINIIMFQKCCGGQHNFGHLCCIGHKLIVHDSKKIFACEALAYETL